jgi:hypothetical protein
MDAGSPEVPLRPVALLEFLARPAPARVVAPDLLVLVHVALLDRLRQDGHLLLGDLAVLVGRRRGTASAEAMAIASAPPTGPPPE